MTGESFADFVRQNEASFYRIAYSYVRNREDALDIVPVSYTHLTLPTKA